MEMQVVSAWLEPLSGEACGPDMEYDPSFMELGQSAAGKPETQFGPAEPPSWPLVREQAESLFGQTRDLRVAILWARAAINTEGLEGLAPSLTLLHGLLANFWDELHPRPDPDDGDTFARVSLLASLDSLDGLLGDVRNTQLLFDRRMGGLRMRDVEVALDKLDPRPEDNTFSSGQIEGMLAEEAELAERVKAAVEASLEALAQLKSLMGERFSTDAVEVKTLQGMLTGLKSLLPGAAPEEAQEESVEDDAPRGRRGGGSVGSIETRQDAVRAINAICMFLERTEPTNPAQMMLRRAERMIDKNFIQLVRDLAPDAVTEVARILGVDPNEFTDGY
ncbi:MAG: type VI secretion system protein TssA [Paucibacter sp.]|nr:type VI secretion system protein TssA [Roseateles sp.]